MESKHFLECEWKLYQFTTVNNVCVCACDVNTNKSVIKFTKNQIIHESKRSCSHFSVVQGKGALLLTLNGDKAIGPTLTSKLLVNSLSQVIKSKRLNQVGVEDKRGMHCQVYRVFAKRVSSPQAGQFPLDDWWKPLLAQA